MGVDTTTLAAIVVKVTHAMEATGGELRTLDAAIGDGDLGLTFTVGARAVRQAVSELDGVEPATVVVACGRAFSLANPSTMGALLGAGLVAAGTTVRGRMKLSSEDFLLMAREAYEEMRRLGRAELGNKTILDAINPSVGALGSYLGRESRHAAAQALRLFAEAAERGAESVDGLAAEVGRASWLGERTRGRRDPGAQSWVLLTRAIERAAHDVFGWDDKEGPLSLDEEADRQLAQRRGRSRRGASEPPERVDGRED